MTMPTFLLLIEAALRALLVALVVWAGIRLLRVSNVMAQKAVWALVLAAAVAMPVMMRWQGLPGFALLRVPVPGLSPGVNAVPPKVTTAPPSERAASFVTAPMPEDYDFRPSAAASGGRYPAPSISKGGYGSATPAALASIERYPAFSTSQFTAGPVAHPIRWQSVAGLLYLAIAAALILRVIVGLAAAVRLWLGGQPVALASDVALSPSLHLRSSRAIGSPVTIGSAVLLPADYAEWDSEKLRIVLAHERSHIRQGDFYLQLLAALYSAIFWFSPLGWWLKSKLRNLGEAIGDHAALNHAASPASYAQLILEFAALPRPTLIGVDMARPSTIAQRIERLLNDSTFRQAFAAGKSRALIAVLTVPVAIFAATALVRVEAAATVQSQAAAATIQSQTPTPAASPSPAGQASTPTPANAAAPAPADAAASADPQQAPETAPAIETVTGPDAALPPHPPLVLTLPGKPGQPHPPHPPRRLIESDGINSADQSKSIILRDQAQMQAQVQALVKTQVNAQVNAQLRAELADKYLQDARIYQLKGSGLDHSYSYILSDNGDSYAIVSGPDTKFVFSGNWHGAKSEDIEKARKMAHGKFLWFTHEGKSYIVEDPAVIAQIEEMYKPMELLGREQGELGRKQEELGKLQGELGKQAELTKIKAPDISKEMAEVNAAMSKLQAEMGKEINREELAEVQGKLAMLQGKLGAMQGGFDFKGGGWGRMGELGAEQGKLGAEQGRLGAEQGRLARDADRKVKSIIDGSLTNGKAKPVE